MKEINFKNVGLIFTTFCGAILAMALIFNACKKDENLNGGFNKASKGQVPYTDFDADAGWYINHQTSRGGWIQSEGQVLLYTKFVGKLEWNGTKVGTGTLADGQANEVQKITIRRSWTQTNANSEYGVNEFPSFCAHVGSWAYSNGSYAPIGLDGKAYMNILSAFNWIFDTYGSIDGWFEGPNANMTWEPGAVSTRVLAQMAVWYYIPADDSDWKITEIRAKDVVRYGATNDAFTALKNAVGDFADYTGSERVSGLAYLAYGLNNNMGENQPQIVPIFKPQEPTKPSGGLTLTKMKRVGNEDVSAEQYEFKFELYETDATGTLGAQVTDSYYGANDDGVFPTNYFAGLVSVFNLDPGYYAFKEINQGDFKLNVGDGTHLYFRINQDGTHTWITPVENETVVNIPNTPPPVLGPAYGSVTATNTWYKEGGLYGAHLWLNTKNGNPTDDSYSKGLVVYNSNHFCFAKLDYSILNSGGTINLAMVVGNKFDQVGTASVKKVGGDLVVTINNFGAGDFGVMAFNKPMTKKMPSNGNIHSQKEADLKKELGATTGFNHNNVLTVPCPAPISGNLIYLYIHCGSIQFFQ